MQRTVRHVRGLYARRPRRHLCGRREDVNESPELPFEEYDMIDQSQLQYFERVNVDAYNSNEFDINEIAFDTHILALPKMALSWKPAPGCLRKKIGGKDITPESFKFLEVLTPRPDFLVIGTGSKYELLSKETSAYLDKLGIPYETMKTFHAIGHLHILSLEDRRIAAALLLPK